MSLPASRDPRGLSRHGAFGVRTGGRSRACDRAHLSLESATAAARCALVELTTLSLMHRKLVVAALREARRKHLARATRDDMSPFDHAVDAIFERAISAIAAGHALVICPQPAARCPARFAVDVLSRAIEAAGGPHDLIGILHQADLEHTEALAAHPEIGTLRLAVGAPTNSERDVVVVRRRLEVVEPAAA